MDVKSISEREIAAYVAGYEEETLELRGYGLSADERAEITAEAVTIYGEPDGPAPVVAPVVEEVAA